MRGRFLLLLLGVLTLVGCGGGGGKPAAVPVGGKVMFQKSVPAVGALVVFHPADPAYEKRIGGKPFAKVKEDGTFALTTFAEGDGAPEGEYGVTVEWRPAGKEAKEPKLAVGDGGGSSPSKLNPRYGNPQQPFTKVTVKKGDDNRFTFDVD
jgi:hypothetical protein